MGREFEKLVKQGDDIGSWSGKANFYSPDRYYEQAESLRVLAFQKYQAGSLNNLKEAFVLMLRFAKFYEVVSTSKAVQKASPA